MYKLLLSVLFVGSVVGLAVLDNADAEYRISAYNEMYTDIKLMYPDRNQICQQGAALVLIGDHEIADKHMQLEGECIRKLVLNHYSK